jgi:hypothetical protein
MSTAKDSTTTTEADDELAAYGGFLYSQDTLKAGKWKCGDLNFIALQNAYMFEKLQELSELGTISGELTALRKEVGERLKGGSCAGLLFLIVILLGIQT